MNHFKAAPIIFLPGRRRARATGLFEQSLDAVGTRGGLLGYLAAGVFLAWWQDMPLDSVLTGLAVLVWPVILLIQLAQMMILGFVGALGLVAAMFVVPYLLGMTILAWKASELRRYIIRVVKVVRGHA